VSAYRLEHLLQKHKSNVAKPAHSPQPSSLTLWRAISLRSVFHDLDRSRGVVVPHAHSGFESRRRILRSPPTRPEHAAFFTAHRDIDHGVKGCLVNGIRCGRRSDVTKMSARTPCAGTFDLTAAMDGTSTINAVLAPALAQLRPR